MQKVISIWILYLEHFQLTIISKMYFCHIIYDFLSQHWVWYFPVNIFSAKPMFSREPCRTFAHCHQLFDKKRLNLSQPNNVLNVLTFSALFSSDFYASEFYLNWLAFLFVLTIKISHFFLTRNFINGCFHSFWLPFEHIWFPM